MQRRTDTEKGNSMSMTYDENDVWIEGQELLDYYLDDDFWDLDYRADLKKENPEEYEECGIPAFLEETAIAEKQSNLNLGEIDSEFLEEFVATDPRIRELDFHRFQYFAVYTFFYTENKEMGMLWQYKFDIYPIEGCTSYTVTRWFTEAN